MPWIDTGEVLDIRPYLGCSVNSCVSQLMVARDRTFPESESLWEIGLKEGWDVEEKL